MSFWKWSRTAANNATADGSINWAEGQAPSTVNDSARAMMAAASKYRDDVAGAIATAGSGTAYTLASFQVFDTLAHMDGAMIAFTAHAGNAGACTLNVDGLGAKPLRSAPATELLAGMLVAGTPYAATYYNVSGEWILRGLTGAPGIPLGVALPYFGVTAPASAFALPFGQAISRLTYANLFNLISTTYGAGDGSTTFNIPDLRGYLLAGKDDMGRRGREPHHRRRLGHRRHRAGRRRRGADGDADHRADARARPRRQRSDPRPRRERPEPQPRRQRSDPHPQHELFDRRDHERQHLAVRIRRQRRRRRQRRDVAGERQRRFAQCQHHRRRGQRRGHRHRHPIDRRRRRAPEHAADAHLQLHHADFVIRSFPSASPRHARARPGHPSSSQEDGLPGQAR